MNGIFFFPIHPFFYLTYPCTAVHTVLSISSSASKHPPLWLYHHTLRTSRPPHPFSPFLFAFFSFLYLIVYPTPARSTWPASVPNPPLHTHECGGQVPKVPRYLPTCLDRWWEDDVWLLRRPYLVKNFIPKSRREKSPQFWKSDKIRGDNVTSRSWNK